jgi:RNA polymerase sigma factor (sigma-70 family)
MTNNPEEGTAKDHTDGERTTEIHKPDRSASAEETSAPDARTSFESLLARARGGDRAAWEGVFDRLADLDREGKKLLGIGRRLLPKHDRARQILDSRDLLQSALKSGWIDVSQFRGQTEGELYSWMRTILRRKLAQSTRRKRPLVGLSPRSESAGDGSDKPGVPSVEPADSHEPQPLESLIEGEIRDRLRGAMDALAPGEREVIKLRLQGLKSPEIAARLGLEPTAVRMRESRAAKALRAILARENED